MGQKSSKHKNYEVGEKVGEGAFGEVYKATDRTGLTVALKKLKMKTKEQRRSAEKELMPLRELVHKYHAHIVKPIDYYVKGKSLWLVFEYCSQGNLNDFLLGQPQKSVILRLMKEIADAVSFLHDNNIVHRDLKPDNVLLTAGFDHRAPVVKVGDFGLAKVCGVGDDSLLEHYSIKSPCGTPFFLAPEVIAAEKTRESYKVHCDVFSMGVIFVSMVEGKRIEGKVVVYLTSPGPSVSLPISIGQYLYDNPSSDLSDKILNDKVNRQFKQLCLSMIRRDYCKRPDASSVLKELNTMNTLEPEPDLPNGQPIQPRSFHPDKNSFIQISDLPSDHPIQEESSSMGRQNVPNDNQQNETQRPFAIWGACALAGGVIGGLAGGMILGPFGAAAGGTVGTVAGFILAVIKL